MKIIEWVAVLGALAWTPHLIGVIKHWITKSKVRVITQKSVEIGFTTYGSIFNLRLALAVENKDIVISDLKIRLKHESGEERVFEWQGITQQLGKMTLPNAGVMPYEKEHSVLAIKLNQKEIEERFIRFQEPSYLASQAAYINKAVKKMSYLKSEGKYEASSFLREPEMTELYSFNKHAFPWKQGKYVVTIELESPEYFSVTDNDREFTLSPLDVEKLEKNKNLLELDYKRMVVGETKEDKGDETVEWQWCNPRLVKT